MIKKLKSLMLYFTVAILLTAAFTIYTNFVVYQTGIKNIVHTEEAENADCVIVFGAAVFGDIVSHTLAKRLDAALEVYRSGKAPKIIVSGDHGRANYNEVRAMRTYLADRGVPLEDIFMDHAGFSTYETIYRARDVFLVNSAIIATQPSHAVRALYIADRLGLDGIGVSAADYGEGESSVQWVRERLACVKAFLQCEIIRPEPRFLGEVIPVFGSGLLTED